MKLVYIDYLTVESGKPKKDVNISVATDHFGTDAQAFITSSQTAKATAKHCGRNILCIMVPRNHHFRPGMKFQK